ncbi:MAG: GTPase [Planctomycetota bacterium]|nr:MAG: GTPase [Planctomycetota bacterium]
MARLAGKLLGANYLEFDGTQPYTKWAALKGSWPRRRGKHKALVIAAQPGDLNRLSERLGWLRGYEFSVGWVIDSFWEDRIPRVAKGHFDQLFITDGDLTDSWEKRTGTSTAWLPWGAEALRQPELAQERPVDLQRLGRQPGAWDDDDRATAAAVKQGMTYRGRPPYSDSLEEGQRMLRATLVQAKYVLAFSNRVGNADYTHKRHEYVTGRWTQALAAGACVAGLSPRCRATRELLWPEGLLELSGIDLESGIAEVAAAAQTWTPEVAVQNRQKALERLDWRHRFAELASALEWSAPRLQAELDEIRELLAP